MLLNTDQSTLEHVKKETPELTGVSFYLGVT